jgi:hypothetical protein
MKITAEILGRGAEGVWWGKRARQDLNLRPLAPEASALSGLSYGRIGKG